jgi:hypothetical protein
VLDWQGPDECQEGARFSSEVARILGGEHPATSLVGRARVARVERHWHLVLGMDHAGRTTTRELDAESCRSATDAAALIVALTIDHDAEDSHAHPAPTSDAATVDAAREDAAVPASTFAVDGLDAAVAERAPSSLPLVVLAELASDTGTLPHTGLGVGGGVGFVAGPFRVEGTFAYWPAISSELAATPSRGGSFGMTVGALRGCALGDVSVLSLGGCAGWSFTSMQGEAFGVTTPISASADWSSFVLDGVALGRVSRRFSLRLTGGLAAPFARPTFEVQGVGVVHRPAPVALRIGAGVEAHF